MVPIEKYRDLKLRPHARGVLPNCYAVRRVAGDRWAIEAPDDDPTRRAPWRTIAVLSNLFQSARGWAAHHAMASTSAKEADAAMGHIDIGWHRNRSLVTLTRNSAMSLTAWVTALPVSRRVRIAKKRAPGGASYAGTWPVTRETNGSTGCCSIRGRA